MNHLIHYPISPIYIYQEKGNESSNTLIYNIEEVGRDQVENFRHSVYVDGSQAIYTPIKQNNIKLFEERKEKKNIVKAKLSLSQKSNSVVANLFISSEQRNADLNNLFKHEISLPSPSSFFTTGEIHFRNKSKLLEALLPNEMQVP